MAGDEQNGCTAEKRYNTYKPIATVLKGALCLEQIMHTVLAKKNVFHLLSYSLEPC